MKKKALLIIVAALTLITLLSGCNTVGTTKYNSEILKFAPEGGVFNYDNLSVMQENWTLTSGGTNSSVFSIVNNGENANNFLQINTSSAGYASAAQTLYLRTYSYYKVTYTYTTSSMSNYKEDVPYVGLYIGFAENEDFNISSDKPTEERGTNTNGSATFYFRTSGIREVNLTINVGTEDNPVNCSRVVLKTLSLTKVDKATAIGSTTGSDLYVLKNAVYGKPSILNVLYVVLGSVGTLIVAYAFYMLSARNKALIEVNSKNKFYQAFKDNKKYGMAAVVSGALLVRLLITLIETLIAGGGSINQVYLGFNLEQLAGFGTWLAEHGTPYFFEYNEAAVFMPFALYLSSLAGLVGRLIGLIPGVTEATITLTVAATLKMFAIIADVGAVAIIYKVISKRKGNVAGAVFAGFYALLPAVFSASAAWGAMDSVAILFVLLTFYFILENNYIGSAISYFTAAMISANAIIFAPFALMYAAFVIYKSIKNKNLKWIQPVVAIVSGLVLFFLVSLPFVINGVAKGNALIAFKEFIATIKGASVYTANAFNFQGLIGNNFETITTQSIFVTVLFVVFALALLAIPYFKNRSRLDLVMLSAAGLIVYFNFCNNSNEYTLMYALPLMLIYTVLVEDKRLYAVFSLYAAFAFINTSYVNMVAGYTDAGINHIAVADTPIMYIMGAFNLVLVIAYVIIAYDTVVSKKSAGFLVLRVPYGEYFSSVSKNTFIYIRNAFSNIAIFFKTIGAAIKEDAAERKARRKDGSDDDSSDKSQGE